MFGAIDFITGFWLIRGYYKIFWLNADLKNSHYYLIQPMKKRLGEKYDLLGFVSNSLCLAHKNFLLKLAKFLTFLLLSLIKG